MPTKAKQHRPGPAADAGRPLSLGNGAARRHDYRPAAHLRGYDHDWNRLADRHKAEHPLCEECERRGLVVAEKLIVDHVVPVDVAPHRRLDPTNLQTLCRPCHKRKTDADKRRCGKT